VRLKHYSLRTGAQYVHWVKRFVLFHGKRHPKDMGAPEVEAFLAHLAVEGKVATSTQNQALSALLFLYREVLEQDLPWLSQMVRAKRPARLPVVLSQREVAAVLDRMAGVHGLMARLLYGTGMRLMEVVRLRVKDVDFERGEILVRDGKGGKDRVTMLPENLILPLQDQLSRAKRLHDADPAAGFGSVWLPDALAMKYPNASKSWGWQYVFPSPNRSVDPRSGVVRRHHVLPESVQKAQGCRCQSRDRQTMHAARAAALVCHPPAAKWLRHPHSSGTAGPTDVSTTMIYTHVLNCGGRGVRSPLDQ
jgi:integron integrase